MPSGRLQFLIGQLLSGGVILNVSCNNLSILTIKEHDCHYFVVFNHPLVTQSMFTKCELSSWNFCL